MDDIFKFWQRINIGHAVHPSDEDVLGRVHHNFQLDCLPACFMGPLKTAPIVLLYLSPGYSLDDVSVAKSALGLNSYKRTLRGKEPLPSPDEHPAAWKWWKSRTKSFGEWEVLRHKVAILDINAYHSTSFRDAPLLASLPSSRACLSWAQGVLFPEALAGNRMVICMRARKYWGLGNQLKYGDALYAPPTTRAGYMRQEPVRDEIINRAMEFLSN